MTEQTELILLAICYKIIRDAITTLNIIDQHQQPR